MHTHILPRSSGCELRKHFPFLLFCVHLFFMKSQQPDLICCNRSTTNSFTIFYKQNTRPSLLISECRYMILSVAGQSAADQPDAPPTKTRGLSTLLNTTGSQQCGCHVKVCQDLSVSAVCGWWLNWWQLTRTPHL